MTKFLEGLTTTEETALMGALQKELIRFKGLLKKDDYWFYREKLMPYMAYLTRWAMTGNLLTSILLYKGR